MTEKTFSIAEAAKIITGSDAPAKVKWLTVRLRRGELPAYKSGRLWRLTAADVEAAIEILRPKRVHIPAVPTMTGLTRTSARRLAS